MKYNSHILPTFSSQAPECTLHKIRYTKNVTQKTLHYLLNVLLVFLKKYQKYELVLGVVPLDVCTYVISFHWKGKKQTKYVTQACNL